MYDKKDGVEGRIRVSLLSDGFGPKNEGQLWPRII